MKEIAEDSRKIGEERRAKKREEKGVCNCGYTLPPYEGPDSCKPENCSHKFAYNALWGDGY